MLVESMTMGFAALQFSAEQQMTEEELAAEGDSGKIAIVISTVLALGLFIALPQFLASLTAESAGWDLGLTDTAFHVLIGGFKLMVFVAYLFAISRIPDVRRLFQYHGAEHKTIHAYEKELPLTVANVQLQSTLHPRCGTTFLVVVIVVSIILGSLAAPVFMPNVEGWLGQLALLVIRIALLPVIAAISYELQRLSARFCTTGWRRMFLYPGFLFQKITTREPDDDHVEIAIAAMEAAAWRDRIKEAAPTGDEPMVFTSFAGFKEVLSGDGSLSASRAA